MSQSTNEADIIRIEGFPGSVSASAATNIAARLTRGEVVTLVPHDPTSDDDVHTALTIAASMMTEKLATRYKIQLHQEHLITVTLIPPKP